MSSWKQKFRETLKSFEKFLKAWRKCWSLEKFLKHEKALKAFKNFSKVSKNIQKVLNNLSNQKISYFIFQNFKIISFLIPFKIQTRNAILKSAPLPFINSLMKNASSNQNFPKKLDCCSSNWQKLKTGWWPPLDSAISWNSINWQSRGWTMKVSWKVFVFLVFFFGFCKLYLTSCSTKPTKKSHFIIHFSLFFFLYMITSRVESARISLTQARMSTWDCLWNSFEQLNWSFRSNCDNVYAPFFYYPNMSHRAIVLYFVVMTPKPKAKKAYRWKLKKQWNNFILENLSLLAKFRRKD